jgi:hypothetical protein
MGKVWSLSVSLIRFRKAFTSSTSHTTSGGGSLAFGNWFAGGLGVSVGEDSPYAPHTLCLRRR